MKVWVIALGAMLAALTLSPIGTATSAVPASATITPVQVPGTTLHGHDATANAGYAFVNAGRARANVESTRHYNIVGNYVCVNAADGTAAAGCYIQFTPTHITCKGVPSGGGNCILTAGPPPMLKAD
jgi:hypothetical protein